MSEWHIAVGHPKEPKNRARRQAVQGRTPKASKPAPRRNARAILVTPTPTLTVAPPTSVVARVTITVTRTSSVVPTSTAAPTTTPVAPTTTEQPTATETPTTTAEPTKTEKSTATEQSTTPEEPMSTEKPTTTERPTTTEEPTKTEKATTTEKPTTTELTTPKQPTKTEETTMPPAATTPEPSTTEEAESTKAELPSTTLEITGSSTTTQKPSTTQEKTPESATTEETETSVIGREEKVPTKTTPSDNFPVKLNSIGELIVYRGQGLWYHIPEDTFYDKEDMFTPNLTLTMKTIEWKKLPESSWIRFDEEKQVIYAFPVDKDTVAIHEYMIIASDSEGGQAYDAFNVMVLDDTDSYNHQFDLVLDYDFKQFSSNLSIQVTLLNKLADFFNLNVSNIRVHEFAEGSVIFKFQLDTIPKDECDSPLRGQFLNDEGEVSSSLENALLPEFRVKSGSFQGVGPCEGPDTGAIGEAPSGKWETYVIIPAVILAVVLLVIMGCLYLVMRSRRKRRMSLEDKQVFVFQKKPAVLQEEYEVKELLLKQPLVLPNEKPPLQPQVYPRSPSLKHANGNTTHSQPYQAPSFTSFKSPSNQAAPGGNTPRKPTYSGYRLPPAYVPP